MIKNIAIIVLILSSSLVQATDFENFSFKFRCVDTKPKHHEYYELTNAGYVDVIIRDKQISIKHNDVFMSRKKISSKDVVTNSAGGFSLIITKKLIYTFSPFTPAFVNVRHSEFKGMEENELECDKGIDDKTNALLIDYYRWLAEEI